MPTQVELISGPIPEGQRSLFSDHSRFLLGLQRRLSAEIKATIDVKQTPTTRGLYDLRIALDHQSLLRFARLAPEDDMIPEANWAKDAALWLSGALNECRHPTKYMFEQVQMRTLVSALALLYHGGVAALDQHPWNELMNNMTARFRAIAFQLNSNSTIAERILQTPNRYLIQMACLYLSFIRCGDSKIPSIAGPVVAITFATVSIVGGQYQHFQQIIQALYELLALRRKPQATYQALSTLQECTRFVTTLARESAREEANGAEREQMSQSLTNLVATLLDNVQKLLEEQSRHHQNGTPKLRGQWPKLRAALQFGPPDLSRGFYFYGILDVTSQLAALCAPSMLRDKRISEEMEALIFRGGNPEYRWKAFEVLLGYYDSRKDQYEWLKKKIKETPGLENREPGREMLVQELNIVWEHLNQEQFGERLCVSPPPTRSPSVDTVSEPDSPRSSVTTLVNRKDRWLEHDLIRRSPLATRTYSQRFGGNGMFSKARSKVCYHSAGLSPDCRYAVFFNDTALNVFDLGTRPSPTSTALPSISKRYKNETVLNALLGRRILLVTTNKSVSIEDITGASENSQIDEVPHGEFDPSGITFHENETDLVVILGQRQVNQRSVEGGYRSSIRVMKYHFNGGKRPSRNPPLIILSDGDCPKLLAYDPGMKMIVCVTQVQHRVVAWTLNNDFSSAEELFEYGGTSYTPETPATGCTSVSIFQAPSQKVYVICTTSPSSERWRNGGEWSFILPVPSPRDRKDRPPKSTIHNLEQFKEHGPLKAGCVSSRNNVLACLEESGKISILSLEKHENGGVCGEQGDARRLEAALSRQEKPSAACMRFHPDDDSLFAIDPKGKIIVTEFK